MKLFLVEAGLEERFVIFTCSNGKTQRASFFPLSSQQVSAGGFRDLRRWQTQHRPGEFRAWADPSLPSTRRPSPFVLFPPASTTFPRPTNDFPLDAVARHFRAPSPPAQRQPRPPNPHRSSRAGKMRSALVSFAAALAAPLVQQVTAAAPGEPSGNQIMLGAWVDTSIEGS